MEKVLVKKLDLRAKILINRNKHWDVFLKALKVYEEQAIIAFQNRIEALRNGEIVDSYLRLERPQDHTRDYERVLQMLDMSVDDEIELSENDFGRYVMDDWEWSQGFIANTSSYLSK